MINSANAARRPRLAITTKRLALILLIPLFAGCAKQHFSEYSGPQIWVTSKTGSADTSNAVPVYYGLPERPYRVIGRIHAGDAKAAWRASDTAKAARLTRSKGGDALMIHCEEGRLAAPSFPVTREHVAALALQWKPQSEADEEAHRLDGLRAYLRRSYPALHLETKRDLWETGVAFVAWQGLDINSQPGAAKLEETMERLIATNGSANSSRWLFKGTLSKMSPRGLPVQHDFYGLATLTWTGTNVSLVSDSEKTSLVFSGRAEGDNSRGEMKLILGATAFTEQLNVTLLPSEIRMENNGAPLRWDFVFLR